MLSTNYVGKNSLARFLEKLYDVFSRTDHVHKKEDITDFPEIPPAFNEVIVGDVSVVADNTSDSIAFVGENITLTPDIEGDSIVIGLTKENVSSALGFEPAENSAISDAEIDEICGGLDESIILASSDAEELLAMLT